MKAYRLLLWVLALATLGALAYGLMAEDPGYLLIEWQGYAAEATLVAALGLLLVLWIGFRLGLALLLWPLRAWRRHGERQSRRRLADGLRALKRGEYALAQRLATRAAKRSRFRVAALFTAVEASRALADSAAEQRNLQSLHEIEPEAARLARAEGLLVSDQAGAAFELLQAAVEPLAPNLRRLRIRAALACGQASVAATDLRVLASSARADDAALGQAVYAALLSASPDLGVLRQRLSEIPKPIRHQPQLIAAYCGRARALGDSTAADELLEQSLRRHWVESLAADYGLQAPAPLRAHMRKAEAWLEEHPDSAALQLVLGRLCRMDGLWGKAESHLLRASRGPFAAAAWEELAATLIAQGDEARARRALQNSIAVARGEPAQALGKRPRSAAGSTSEALERRSTMGVPLLADGSAPEAR